MCCVAADLGVEITKGAKVLTVFSSSHYCGEASTRALCLDLFCFKYVDDFARIGGHNSAAAVLVADDKIKVVIVQPYQQAADPPVRCVAVVLRLLFLSIC